MESISTKQEVGHAKKVQRTICLPERIDAQLLEVFRELRSQGDVDHFSGFFADMSREWLVNHGYA